MLTRLYVDNYKSFSNFTYEPARVELLMGGNGTGKSSIFEVVARLQLFLAGEAKAIEVWPANALTRWDTRHVQSFELECELPDGTYVYHLDLEHEQAPEQGERSRVVLETLIADGKPLFRFELGRVQLYRDDHSEGPQYSFDWSRSGLAHVGPSNDNARLQSFRDGWVGRVQVVRPDTRRMAASCTVDADGLAWDASNFASWLQVVYLEQPELLRAVNVDLEPVFSGSGFEGLRFRRVGGDRFVLQMSSRAVEAESGASRSTEFDFDELSDGQRVLVLLYALLHSLKDSPGRLLCIDEPAASVSLGEIQPWLASLDEVAEVANAQVLLTSHHPEVIDFMAARAATRLFRERGGPTRLQRFRAPEGNALTASEVVKRGWEDAV